MNAIKFNFTFDQHKMAQELQDISSAFETIHSRSTQDGKLKGIHLINSKEAEGQGATACTYLPTPELNQSPYLRSVLNTFKCNKFNYRVHSLTSGGKITLHRDHGKSLADRVIRIHIPVTTNEEVYFYVNGERIQMQNGECWLADITKPHEVENRSLTDRMQLMIDCDLNDWWEKILEDHGISVPAPSKWSNYSVEDLQAMKANLLHNDTLVNSTLIKELNFEIMQRVKMQA